MEEQVVHDVQGGWCSSRRKSTYNTKVLVSEAGWGWLALSASWESRSLHSPAPAQAPLLGLGSSVMLCPRPLLRLCHQLLFSHSRRLEAQPCLALSARLLGAPSRFRRASQVALSSVQSVSPVRLFATPWTAARQASLSIINSWSLLKLVSW